MKTNTNQNENRSYDILIAEDENIIAKDIEFTLKDIGYNVVGSARSGKDILKAVSESNPDLVLMDIMLEGEMDGIETAKIIKDKFNIPIIYLTAISDSETLEKAKITDPFAYLIKPFDKKSLRSTIEVALYKHSMNKELHSKTVQLEKEKTKSDNLLNNIFPAELVKELKQEGIIKPREFKNVTLLFTDFEGFTKISAGLSPNKLVDELNDIFQNFDMIIDKYGLEKLKTIGDSYMIAGGLPIESKDHAENVISAAFEMHDYINERNRYSGQKWQMRSGAHSGRVVAGVIGKKKYTFDVWGDTVNIANRMEKYGKPGKLNITKSTKELIEDKFNFDFHKKIELDGNGKIEMYFVNRK